MVDEMLVAQAAVAAAVQADAIPAARERLARARRMARA